jgi:hypothetical protein
MVGPDAPEIMQGVAIAIKAGATKAHFDSTVGSPWAVNLLCCMTNAIYRRAGCCHVRMQSSVITIVRRPGHEGDKLADRIGGLVCTVHPGLIDARPATVLP